MLNRVAKIVHAESYYQPSLTDRAMAQRAISRRKQDENDTFFFLRNITVCVMSAEGGMYNLSFKNFLLIRTLTRFITSCMRQ